MAKAESDLQRRLGELVPELAAFVRRRASAELEPGEIMQTVALRALAHADQLRDPERTRAWVFRIARNVLAEQARRSSRAPELRPIDDAPPSAPEAEEPSCWCVLAQVHALRPEYAGILQRVVIEERSLRDVAGELGITENNATVRLSRARGALRAQLRAHCGTGSSRSCAECGCEERGCCPRPE